MHGSVNVMPIRLFSHVDFITSIGVEMSPDTLQGTIFSTTEHVPNLESMRHFLDCVSKKKVHNYMHTDFSLDPFRRCGPWCLTVTEGNCDGKHHFPFGIVKFAALSLAPWARQQRS